VATDEALLSVTGIHKRFGGVHALRGADLTVRRGEVHSLVGANGSGKSTLLNILGTLDRPSDGKYILDGQDVGSLGDRALAQFEKSLKLDPNHGKTLLNVGIVRAFGKQDLDGASQAWQQVIKLSPDSPEGQAAKRALDSLQSAHPGTSKPGG